MTHYSILPLLLAFSITSCGSGTQTQTYSAQDDLTGETQSGDAVETLPAASVFLTSELVESAPAISVAAEPAAVIETPDSSTTLDTIPEITNSDSAIPAIPVPVDEASLISESIDGTNSPAQLVPAIPAPVVAASTTSTATATAEEFAPPESDTDQEDMSGQLDVVSTSSATAPNNAFGLTQRAALPATNLPIAPPRLGNYQLINAYPNLAFQEALLVDDVPGENRLVVVEQRGRVHAFEDDPAATASNVVLDYSGVVAQSGGEQGLLGLAFDPGFIENRYVYLNYIDKDTNQSIVARMAWDKSTDTLDATNAKIVLRVDQPYTNHNGGMIAFGPDNFLYIALGDGGNGGDPDNNAQNRANLLGSILRIDVRPQDDSLPYTVPDSNPFVGEQNVRPEIYAYGLRNPWRFSFDRQTGEMWLGDVGQEQLEEINVVSAGGNYGWRAYEGTRARESNSDKLNSSSFIAPIHEYNHDVGLAVIGGYVYRGAVASLQGRYLYTDFYNGTVTALSLNAKNVTSVDTIGSIEGPTSFGETKDGELLVVSRYGGLFKFIENSVNVEVPGMLSQTGLFDDLTSLIPNKGMIEYAPSHAFWSDGATKRRWIGIPDNKTIDFSDNDWTFPIGTISVKHFEMDIIRNSPGSARRLETRVMFNTAQGWQGYSYRWNAAQTDAQLVPERQTEYLSISLNDGTTAQQRYDYPGPADCASCHTHGSNYLLGLETKQLNSNFGYAEVSDNQLRSLNNIRLFNIDIGAAEQYQVMPALNDESASVEQRARAYLDVNCSTCHQPQGSSASGIDFRMEISNAAMNSIGVAPMSGNFGISDAQIISPGSKERSMIWYRMRQLDGSRMPPISSHRVDDTAVQLIGQWIDSM